MGEKYMCAQACILVGWEAQARFGVDGNTHGVSCRVFYFYFYVEFFNTAKDVDMDEWGEV